MNKKKSIFESVMTFFDKFEDRVRGRLSRKPLLYAFIGGIGVVLFWRGIWHTADMFPSLNGPVSTIIGLVILLATGIFVSAFVGNRLILTGLTGEKKLTDKTRDELQADEAKMHQATARITTALEHIEEELAEIKEEIK